VARPRLDGADHEVRAGGVVDVESFDDPLYPEEFEGGGEFFGGHLGQGAVNFADSFVGGGAEDFVLRDGGWGGGLGRGVDRDGQQEDDGKEDRKGAFGVEHVFSSNIRFAYQLIRLRRPRSPADCGGGARG
jgi:hypothetical protein